MTKIKKTLVRVSPLGVIVSTILIAGCVAPVGARGENAGVADNNMSDATHQATYGTPPVYRTRVYPWMTHHSARTPANAGVADNNMTDAVREATIRAAAAKAGVADNNMSDATHAATYGANPGSLREIRPR